MMSCSIHCDICSVLSFARVFSVSEHRRQQGVQNYKELAWKCCALSEVKFSSLAEKEWTLTILSLFGYNNHTLGDNFQPTVYLSSFSHSFLVHRWVPRDLKNHIESIWSDMWISRDDVWGVSMKGLMGLAQVRGFTEEVTAPHSANAVMYLSYCQ
jgi:hypothetical protein